MSQPDQPPPDSHAPAGPQPPLPDQTAPADRTRPPRVHPMNFTLDGLPELEQFTDAEQRQRALLEIGRAAGNPLKLDWWIAVGILVASVLATATAARYLGRALGLIGWQRDLLQLGICLTVFIVVLRGLHRCGARSELRQKLLGAGVPVCLGCGYSLRGHPPDAACCPECGRAIDPAVRAVMQKVNAE